MWKTQCGQHNGSMQDILGLQRLLQEIVVTETKVLYWIYTMAIQPIISYAALVW